MELTRGTLVSQNVRLAEPLGEGGMGAVWIADHLSLRTRVAVKFISAAAVRGDPALVERFNREASLAAQIKSPHVVQIFDHGVMDDGRPYMVMELLEGESLAERLEREGCLDAKTTKLVVTQTAKALGRAHKLGVVHRDIKPDNIFLMRDDDGELFVKVLDFGIAKEVGPGKAAAVTTTGVMVGTPEYMSPEQVLSARSVDHRSDLWSLGVVAYVCLTGTTPFKGETLGSLCVAIAHGEFAPPSELRRTLPPEVDQWFRRVLCVDPRDRIQQARELAHTFALAVTPGAPVEDELNTTGDGRAAAPVPPDARPSAPDARPSAPDAATAPAIAATVAREATSGAWGAPASGPEPAPLDSATIPRPPAFDPNDPPDRSPRPARGPVTFAGTAVSRERGGAGGKRAVVIALAAAATLGAVGVVVGVARSLGVDAGAAAPSRVEASPATEKIEPAAPAPAPLRQAEETPVEPAAPAPASPTASTSATAAVATTPPKATARPAAQPAAAKQPPRKTDGAPRRKDGRPYGF